MALSVIDRKHFLDKFGSKNQNCQFVLKSGTYSNSKMHDSMVMFTFSALDEKYPFRANFV